MPAYEYAVKGLHKVPAQQMGEFFEQLEHSASGLNPESVLDASREEGTLLHDEFEWDNDVAAEKYRLNQAQEMMTCLRIVIAETDDTEERTVYRERGFVSIPGGKSAYVSIRSAMTNDVWREHLMEQARRDMETFCAKYQRLGELAPVIQAMKDIQGR